MSNERQREQQQITSSTSPMSHHEIAADATLDAVPNMASIIQRAKKDPHTLSQLDVIRLQHSVGNRAVRQLLSSSTNKPVTVQRDDSNTNIHNGDHGVIQRVVTKEKWGKGFRWKSSNTNKYYGSKEKAVEEDSKVLPTIGDKRKSMEVGITDVDDGDGEERKDNRDERKYSREEEERDVVEQVEKRPRRIKKVSLQALDTHFQRPTYTKETAHRNAGGKKSTAILGPNSNKDMGTDADSSLPAAIGSARGKYPEHHFKAGHLVNADFYGTGLFSSNLTILTAAANRNMQSFDNDIKHAVGYLKRLYEALSEEYVDISKLTYGIHISVEVSDEKWGNDYPDNCIAKRVTCVASVYGGVDLTSFNLSESRQNDLTLYVNLINAFINRANSAGNIDNE